MATTKKTAKIKISIKLPYEDDFRNYLKNVSNLQSDDSYDSYVSYVKNAFSTFYADSQKNRQWLKNCNPDQIIQDIVNNNSNIELLQKVYIKLHDIDKANKNKTYENACSGLSKYIDFLKQFNINKDSKLEPKLIEFLNKIGRKFDNQDISNIFYSRLNTQDRFTDKCWFPIGLLTNEVCKKLDSISKCNPEMSQNIRNEVSNIFFIGQSSNKTIHYIKLKQIDLLEFDGKGRASFTSQGQTYKLCTKSLLTDEHEKITIATKAYNISLLHIDHDPEISLVLSKSIWPRLRILKAEIQDTINKLINQGVAIQQGDPNDDTFKEIKKEWGQNGYPQIPYLRDEIKDLHDCMTLTVLVGKDNLAKNNKKGSKSINNNGSEEESINVKKKIANSVSPDLKLEQLYGIIGIERTKKKFE